MILLFYIASKSVSALSSSLHPGTTPAKTCTALYGKPYTPAAKDTWNTHRKRGIDALVNDSLTGIFLTSRAYIVGRECGKRLLLLGLG